MITSIYGLLDWQFWLYGLIFFGFVWLILRGLGFFWLRPDQSAPATGLDWITQQALLIVLGLASFTIMGFVFARLEIRVLQWLTIAMGLLGSILLYRHAGKQRLVLSQIEKITVLLTLVGSALQLVAIIASGLREADVVRFYFTNSQDGMMHLAFARALTAVFPPVRPELLNIPLTNYHYFTDLLLADQARLLGIPITHAFFQFWPLTLSILAGILIAASMKEIVKNPLAQWIALFLWYLSGELSYFWSILLHHDFNWNIATIENSADQFLNMPQMFAKILIFAVYLLALRWYREQQQKNWFFSALILVVVSSGFKIYFGLFNLALLLALIFFGILAKQIAVVPRKQFLTALTSLTLPLFLTVLCTATIFFAVSDGGSKLNWVPLAWPKLLLSAEHLDFTDWWLRWQVYEAAQSWKGMMALQLLAVCVALMSMIGTKILGFTILLPTRRQWWWQLPILLAIGLAITIGFNTLQNPGGFNTYNFVIVATQPLFLLTAVALTHCWQKSKLWKLLVVIILIAGAIRPLANINKYLHAQQKRTADASYSGQQITALNWLAKNSPVESAIQAVPSNQQNQQSAFLSFFSERATAVAAENITVSHNLDYQSRQEIITTAFAVSEWQLLRANLTQLGIDYVYIDLTRDQEVLRRIPDLLDHSVYQNETTAIISL